MRLARALAAAGVCSRREAEARIRAGRVTVNDTVITDVATNVDGLNDAITHDGVRVFLERPTTIALYKPEGVITTVTDTHGRQTVRDLLPNVRERVYPVGRLDADASGLLLLTNDGDLAFRLAHPRYGVKKTYRVWVEGRPTDYALRRLARGVLLDRGERKTGSAHVTLVRGIRGGSVLRVTLSEGRKHEIKRMCESIGHPCTRLVREKFAGLTLSGLSPGRSRELSFRELHKLRKLVGLEVDPKQLLQELDQRAVGEATAPDAAAEPHSPERKPEGRREDRRRRDATPRHRQTRRAPRRGASAAPAPKPRPPKLGPQPKGRPRNTRGGDRGRR